MSRQARIEAEVASARREGERFPPQLTNADGSAVTVAQAAAELRMRARQVAHGKGMTLVEAAKCSECHELLRALVEADHVP